MENMQREGKREVKSSVFVRLFEDDESKIELFNALLGTNLGPEAKVQEVTIDDVLYHGKKNDLGFIIEDHFLVLTEHQSTINENMPMRQLQYVARTYETIVSSRELFKVKQVKVPMPEFFVIYTGEKEWEEEYLKLSDGFMTVPVENSMELVVKVINVGYNENAINPILERSEKLKGYSILLSYLAESRRQGYGPTKAIDIAVERCLHEGILEDFLKTNSSEVGSMLFDDITTEEFIELRVEEALEEAVEKAVEKAVEEAVEKAVEETTEKAQKEERKEIARAMKVAGYDNEQISKLTKLAIKDVEDL